MDDGANTNANGNSVASWVDSITLFGAELAYLCLALYLAWITFSAKDGHTPGVSPAVAGATGALAAAFGVGYATVLGVPPAGSRAQGFAWLSGRQTLQSLLAIGVFLYMAAGALLGAAYVTNSAQAPSIVRTIAIAFGGYVVGYVGIAYKNYTGS